MGGIIYDGGYLDGSGSGGIEGSGSGGVGGGSGDGSGGGSVWNWVVVEPVLLMKVYYLQVSMIYYNIV